MSVKDDYKLSIDIARDMLNEIPKGAEMVVARAFNRALVAGRTAATSKITKLYTVRAKDVRGTFLMKRAAHGHLDAELISKGSALPLRAFAHNPTSDTTGAKRKPIRVTIKAGETYALTTSFVWRGNIFDRLGNSRTPIKKMVGPSVPSMLGNDDIVDEVQSVMNDTAEKRLEHELSRLIEGK